MAYSQLSGVFLLKMDGKPEGRSYFMCLMFWKRGNVDNAYALLDLIVFLPDSG